MPKSERDGGISKTSPDDINDECIGLTVHL